MRNLMHAGQAVPADGSRALASHRRLLAACSLGPDRADEVGALIRGGADLRATDRHGWTPLINASFHGHVNSVFAIIRAASRALSDEEFMAYLRQKDGTCGIDACGWAALHKKDAVTALFNRYGIY